MSPKLLVQPENIQDMLRLMLFPLLLLFGVALFVVFAFYVYGDIKRALRSGYTKGVEIVNKHQEKRQEKESLKNSPSIVQKGFDDYREIEALQQSLPVDWQLVLASLLEKSKSILQVVLLDKSEEQRTLSIVRPFFVHTLDALKHLVQKLESDLEHISALDVSRVHDNINVINNELLHHQTCLEKARKHHFDVSMDVIKARLKP